MEVQTQPILLLYRISCDSWEMNSPEMHLVKAVLAASHIPPPQLNITSWSLWDYQLPGSSYTRSSVVGGSSVVATVVPATNPRAAGDGVQRGKAYDQRPPNSACTSPPPLLDWEKLCEKEALQKLLAITLHLQMMKTVGWHFRTGS